MRIQIKKLTGGTSAHVSIGSITSTLRVGKGVSHDENHSKDSRRMGMLVWLHLLKWDISVFLNSICIHTQIQIQHLHTIMFFFYLIPYHLNDNKSN